MLNKNILWAINFSATQELDRIQQKQILDISDNKINLESNKNEVDILKIENQELKSRVDTLETELNNLKSIVQELVDAQSST